MLRIIAATVALAAVTSAAITDKAVFTRWGSRDCPAGTSMLYEGIASGARYNHRGSGANILCLHGNAKFQGNEASGSNTNNNDGGLVYGTEYQNTGSLDSNHDRDASCAVCQTNAPGEVYTQWGRAFGCSNDHVTMYNGLVMSNHYTQERSEFVCVDTERAYHQKQWNGNQDGNMWYTVETEGGSMDEYLYPQDKEVGCSVCHAPRAVYTRWGSRSCAKGSTMMYEGIASGSHYSHRGGGHNNVCLHQFPQIPLGWGGNNNGGLLYGVEYQNTGTIDKNHDKDAACSVCMADTQGHAYIQWGRSKTCSNGHTQLYKGVVLSERYNHYKGSFQCVDEERAFHARSNNGDQNGALWYSAEVESGSMDESKYRSNQEIGCSMCLAPKAVYVIWGNTACPSGSGKKLYTGFAASGSYSDRGGGSNAICLHETPEVLAGASTGNQNGGRIFGTEYQNTGTLDKNHDKDAACTVCILETAGATYTQWGRSSFCSGNHKTLYKGLVMSNHYSQNKNEFVCVDLARGFHAKSSNADQNGNLWYTVEVESGSMDEDIYQHNREIGCTVCVSESVAVVTPWYEQQQFLDMVAGVDVISKTVDGHTTGIKATNDAAALLGTLVGTKASTTQLNGVAADLVQAKNDITDVMSSSILALKLQGDRDLAAAQEGIRTHLLDVFTDSSKLDLPDVPVSFDWSVMCNGMMDDASCMTMTCNTTDYPTVLDLCPAQCGSCVVNKKKSSIATSNGQVVVKVNQGESVVVDNGYEDALMTQTQVQDLVRTAISAAFGTTAEQFNL